MKAKELADMLQISDKTLRAWLRVNFTRPLSEKGKEWNLNDKQIIAAIEWFKRIKIKRTFKWIVLKNKNRLHSGKK